MRVYAPALPVPAVAACGLRFDNPLSQLSERTRLLDVTHAWSLLSQRTSLFGRVLAERAMLLN